MHLHIKLFSVAYKGVTVVYNIFFSWWLKWWISIGNSAIPIPCCLPYLNIFLTNAADEPRHHLPLIVLSFFGEFLIVLSVLWSRLSLNSHSDNFLTSSYHIYVWSPSFMILQKSNRQEFVQEFPESALRIRIDFIKSLKG